MGSNPISPFMIPTFVAIVSISISSFIYAIVAYDTRCANNAFLSYLLSIIAAIISVSAWTYVVRYYRDPNATMIINVAWDLGVGIMLILFPLILFDLKIDTKTIIGCVIATIGLLIAKL